MKFSLGSPFNNSGAGRVKTSPQNERRIDRVLSNFQSSPQGAVLKGKEGEMSVTKSQASRNMILFPLVGFAVGLVGSFSFVHANSQYIGKCFTLLTTLLGYQLYKKTQQNYEFSRKVGMFPYYPKEIQQMLQNNDFRYARQWLNAAQQKR